MSELIDLDLVELRCRLRGWAVLPGYGEVCVKRPEGDLWLRLDADPTTLRGDAAMLALPRWTLDRLMSDPPEGWTCIAGQLSWGDVVAVTRRHEIEASIANWQGNLGLDIGVYGDAGPDELARFAVRLRAAAELALILAEVEP